MKLSGHHDASSLQIFRHGSERDIGATLRHAIDMKTVICYNVEQKS